MKLYVSCRSIPHSLCDSGDRVVVVVKLLLSAPKQVAGGAESASQMRNLVNACGIGIHGTGQGLRQRNKVNRSYGLGESEDRHPTALWRGGGLHRLALLLLCAILRNERPHPAVAQAQLVHLSRTQLLIRLLQFLVQLPQLLL